jgi:hypothetical protein
MFTHIFYGRAAYADDPLPNIVYFAIWMPAGIFCLVLEKKKKKAN